MHFAVVIPPLNNFIYGLALYTEVIITGTEVRIANPNK